MKNTGFTTLSDYTIIGKKLSADYKSVDKEAVVEFECMMADMELQDLSITDKLRILFAIRHTRPMLRGMLRDEAKRIVEVERQITRMRLCDIQGMSDGEAIVSGVLCHIISPVQAILCSFGRPEVVHYVMHELTNLHEEDVLLVSNFMLDVYVG